MNLANLTFQSVRLLLLPVSLVYGGVVWMRNQLFNKKYYHSVVYNLPIICIGNLSVGGTGKSPMVEYLIRLLKDEYKIATLSRGYKRKTKGYALANENSTALDIGDEPMQFHLKFPNVAVAVGEKRNEAIPQLLHDRPETQVILLDDGFQHRSITPGFSILLTDYSNLFTRDFYLPTGDLRDSKSSYKRANIIVVTKCDTGLTIDKSKKITEEIKLQEHQQIFFSSIEYGTPYHILEPATHYHLHRELELLLVTGIANIAPLKKYILDHTNTYEKISFSDHHVFTIDDLKEIEKKFEKISYPKKIILTTEKDAVRLVKFKEQLAHLPLYVLPIHHRVLFNQEDDFKNTVSAFIKNFGTQQNN
jgi:tetraacyldisaccharide 4'-kinase